MKVLDHRFFRHFPPQHAKRLARAAQRVTFPARTIIFEEGDPSDSVHLMLSGRVEILKHSSGGHFHTLAYASEGDYFGELGVLDGSGRSARAVTQTEVHAAVLPCRVVLAVLRQCPWETTMGLFRHVIANLREINSRYVQEVIRKERITLIGEMANSFLHDFRSPVTSIQLALGAITKRSDDEPTRRACDTISHQLRRMSSLVEDVLQYARGNSTLDRRRVPLRNLFKHLLYLNAETLRHAGITARVRAAGGLVAAIDHDRMIRVLQNLLSNAIEALGTDPKGLIVLAARRRRDGCELTVRDNGPGIPKVIWSALFQPFTSHGKPGGTGLGVAIAKGIVEAHGGEITFESKKGAGTTFRIRLPLPA
ncbi:MAG TPA: ATP-binding protein [Opitutaceae bacterium]|nr:ATP-binding protein [Opitutaceae bacterium]